MNRVAWFAIGAILGAAYGSMLVDTHQLRQVLGRSARAKQARTTLAEYKEHLQEYKSQLASALEQRSSHLGDTISDRGQEMANQIRNITFAQETSEHVEPVVESKP